MIESSTQSWRTLLATQKMYIHRKNLAINGKDTWQIKKYFLTYKADKGLNKRSIRKTEQLTNTQRKKKNIYRFFLFFFLK